MAMTATTYKPLASRAFDACVIIWDAMAQRSIPVAEAPKYIRRVAPAEVERVYVGQLVNLFRSLGFTSTSSYHYRRHELMDMGCIRQLWRGGRYGSAWGICERPPMTFGYGLWERNSVNGTRKYLTTTSEDLRTSSRLRPRCTQSFCEKPPKLALEHVRTSYGS